MHTGCNCTRTVVFFWLPNVEKSFKSKPRRLQPEKDNVRRGLIKSLASKISDFCRVETHQSSLNVMQKSISKWTFSKAFSFAYFDSSVLISVEIKNNICVVVEGTWRKTVKNCFVLGSWCRIVLRSSFASETYANSNGIVRSAQFIQKCLHRDDV